MKLQILYEDDDIVAINKPSGLVVHSDGRTEEPTVVDWVLKNYPSVKGVGDVQKTDYDVSSLKFSEERPGIVHRLDRDTSGVLLIAKNQTSFARLKKQFQRQQVHKVYHAFVYGRVKNNEGIIDRPIARNKRNSVLWSATRGKRGEEREAITEYRVLSRGEDFTFLELRPRTGRTHQIRVHLKAINYPIICDKLYAPKFKEMLGFKRLALHSHSISFLHPMKGNMVKIEAPYPRDFKKAIRDLESKADL